MEIKCKACTKQVQKAKAIQCGGPCGCWFHLECAEIVEVDFKKIIELSGLVLWLCSECKLNYNNFKTVAPLTDRLDQLENKVDMVNNNIILMRDEKIQSKSYAQAIQARPTETNKRLSTITVRPKKSQTSQDTSKHVRRAVNPADTKTNIWSVNETKRGSIIITLGCDENPKVLLEHMQTKVGEDYDININSSRSPRIKILGLNKRYDEESLKSDIINQNHWANSEDKLTIKYTKQERSGKWVVYLETNGSTFEKYMEKNT